MVQVNLTFIRRTDGVKLASWDAHSHTSFSLDRLNCQVPFVQIEPG